MIVALVSLLNYLGCSASNYLPSFLELRPLVLPHQSRNWNFKKYQLQSLIIQLRQLVNSSNSQLDEHVFYTCLNLLETTLKTWNVPTPLLAFKEIIEQEKKKDSLQYLQTVFGEILPGIIDFALEIESLDAKEPIHLLKTNEHYLSTLKISREYTRCLLSHLMLGTFEDRANFSLYETYPRFTANIIISSKDSHQVEKLKMLLCYFQQVLNETPKGFITIYRRQVDTLPSMKNVHFSDIHFHPTGRLEDLENAAVVDFANKYIGGGTLGGGCVQEEIMFMRSPELIISMLVCEVMSPKEAIVIKGSQVYSQYTGYSGTLKFAGAATDVTEVFEDGSRGSEVLAMDAVNSPGESQFLQETIERNILKAYCAFLETETNYRPIATGNWGCGVFKNDLHFQFIIQWIAASLAGRSLHYYFFEAQINIEKLKEFEKCVTEQKITVEKVFLEVLNFNTKYPRGTRQKRLLDYLHSVFVSK